jgi:hypothetical protein
MNPAQPAAMGSATAIERARVKPIRKTHTASAIATPAAAASALVRSVLIILQVAGHRGSDGSRVA